MGNPYRWPHKAAIGVGLNIIPRYAGCLSVNHRNGKYRLFVEICLARLGRIRPA